MRQTIILLFLLIDAALAEDKGLGLVYFSEHGPMSNAFQSDSIVILHSRNESSRVVATFVLTIQPENRGYQYKVRSLSQLHSENIIEYAYEVSGLPVDRVNTSANWLRVVYGFSKQGTPLRGWVKLQRPRYDILLWSTELQKHPLFFSPEPKTPEFYNHPGGEKARFTTRETLRFWPSKVQLHFAPDKGSRFMDAGTCCFAKRLLRPTGSPKIR